MPTKKLTRSTRANTRTRSSSKKVVTKKQTSFSKVPILSKLLSNKPALFIVLGFAALGMFFLFRTNAATTNFEAESASASGGAKTGLVDSSASNSKYAQFSTSSSSTAKVSRFPGDPNPLVTGKAYWGAAINGNGDPARHETPTGKSLSIRRTYFGWSDRSTKMVTMAKNDIAANRLPFVSTKTPAWNDMGAGKHDAEIDDMLRKLDALGGPVWLALHHEPEGGGGGGVGPNKEDDISGSAGWIRMQKRVRERMNALGTKNIALVANLMTWTWDTRSGRNPNDWWADNVWDVYTANSYCDDNPSKGQYPCLNGGETAVSISMWKNFENFAISKKIPYGTGEWGDRGEATGAGNDIKKTWDYGFTNKRDLVAWTYFDSNLNSDSGGWELKGEALNVFRDISQNDARVQRIKDLSVNQTVNNFGSLTTNVSVPSSSTYKIWVRMSAPDTNNNAVQLQVDGGTVVKVGDSSINPNTWTWVDYKNGNVGDKLSMALSAGTRKITLTGIEPGVKIDRVLITDETCQPIGTGENCTIITTNPPPPTNDGSVKMEITSPRANETVVGKKIVTAMPADNVESVSFRVNNVWQYTDDKAPFEWEWDSTKTPNGSASITIRPRKTGNPGGYEPNKAYERTVDVIVKNSTSTPTPPPVDTEAPTKPNNLGASLRFDATKLRYVFDLKWTSSSDNAGVTGYNVASNGKSLGSTTNTSFTDTSVIESGKPYNFTVIAKDTANNLSPTASIMVRGDCFLVWCSTTML